MTRSSVVGVGAAIVLLTIECLGTAVPAAGLDAPPKLGLTPVGEDGAYFELTLEPGDRRELQVEVANFGGGEVLARTYAADVYSIINGGLGVELFDQPSSETTFWVTYPAQTITLDAQGAVVIDFEVAVPLKTPPGEYVTGLAVENVEPFSGSGPVAIDQVNRSAIAVAIDVPGARRPDLEIGDVAHTLSGGQSVITFEVENPGNVHLKPAGDFTLLDAAGRELAAGGLTMGSVYAGTGTLLEAPLAEPLPEGDYCAELRLADEKTGISDATECLPFTVEIPSKPDVDQSRPGSEPAPLTLPSTDAVIRAAPLIGVGIVLVGFAFLWIARRRRRRAGYRR